MLKASALATYSPFTILSVEYHEKRLTKKVYHSKMFYSVRSLKKRREKQEETIALMASPLVQI